VLAFFGAAIAGAYLRPAEGDGLLESSAALAVLVAGGAAAATDWMWEIPVVFAPVVIAAALLTGPATQPPSPDGARSRFGWGVATLVAGWLAILASGIALLTELKLDDSHEAVRDGDLSAAARDARDAISLQPWAAEPRLQLALVEERGGDLPAASADLEEAIARARDDWAPWVISARIETKAGRVDEAEDSLDRARELNPRSTLLSPVQASPATSPASP
jgi:tetratricopeptide (TPR) repeat protein